MFKKLLVASICAVTLVACEEVESPQPAPQPEQQQSTRNEPVRSYADGLAAFNRVRARVNAQAVAVCNQFRADLPARYCQFQYNVLNNDKQPANAFQSWNRAGQPVITFNSNMLRTVRNDHEIAFILGHEAGHQIARHLIRRRENATAGAVLGAIIGSATGIDPSSAADLGGAIGGRAYSKEWELQADVLGTHIAARAGYNPEIGAQSFNRFSGSNALLSTHPPGPDRIATVQRTYAQIKAGNRRIPCFHC